MFFVFVYVGVLNVFVYSLMMLMFYFLRPFQKTSQPFLSNIFAFNTFVDDFVFVCDQCVLCVCIFCVYLYICAFVCTTFIKTTHIRADRLRPGSEGAGYSSILFHWNGDDRYPSSDPELASPPNLLPQAGISSKIQIKRTPMSPEKVPI